MELLSVADIAVDTASALVLAFMLAMVISYRKVKPEEDRYTYLIWSLSLMVSAFLFKIAANVVMYSLLSLRFSDVLLVLEAAHEAFESIFTLLILYRIAMLIGFYLLYSIYAQRSPATTNVLVISLLLIVGYASRTSYFVFHLALLVIIIITATHLFGSYRRNRRRETKVVGIAFIFLALANAALTFMSLHDAIYSMASLLQLIGYGLLFIVLFKVSRDGQKTGPH